MIPPPPRNDQWTQRWGEIRAYTLPSAIGSCRVDPCGGGLCTNTSSTTVRDQMYIHGCRISIKYTGRADIVGQYRPGSQVQQPILGCALKPRPLFRGCINHISLSVFKSSRGYLNFFSA